jgi:hypothetical protein
MAVMTSDKRSQRKPGTGQPKAFDAVAGMAEGARDLAGRLPNRLNELAEQIRALAASEIDPYLLVGILLEGMVHTVSLRIPQDRQPDTVLATLTMLQQRMQQCVSDPKSADRCGLVPGNKG